MFNPVCECRKVLAHRYSWSRISINAHFTPAFILIWAIVRSRWTFLPLVALIISWQQISVFFAFGKLSSTKNTRPANTLRILNWNVSSWDEANKHKNGGQSHRKDMLGLIKAQNPDILCLQEFF